MVGRVNEEAAYRESYRLLRQLLDPLNEERLADRCPACPAWSIRDVLGHVASVLIWRVNNDPPAGFDRKTANAALINSDPSARDLARRRRDQWLEVAIDGTRSLPLDELFRQWEQAMARAQTDVWPGPQADFAVHLGDVEEALGSEASRGSAIHATALQLYGDLVNRQLRASDLDVVQLAGTDPTSIAGDQASSNRISGPTYELVRVVAGRRTRTEANRALDWGTTPEEIQAQLPVYDWVENPNA